MDRTRHGRPVELDRGVPRQLGGGPRVGDPHGVPELRAMHHVRARGRGPPPTSAELAGLLAGGILVDALTDQRGAMTAGAVEAQAMPRTDDMQHSSGSPPALEAWQ